VTAIFFLTFYRAATRCLPVLRLFLADAFFLEVTALRFFPAVDLRVPKALPSPTTAACTQATARKPSKIRFQDVPSFFEP